jgi:hypothetical protein
MPFEINYELSDSIPALAWVAEYESKSNCLNVIHGSLVEISTLGLIEGAWGGDFPSFDFHKTAVLSGTGFCHHDDKLFFCSSTDQMCPIFSLEIAGKLHISNSPVFLMVQTGSSPIPSYPYYHFNLLRTYRQGLHCLDGAIPLAQGAEMRIHICAILIINDKGAVSFQSHDPGPCPKSFEDYHSQLLRTVNAVIENSSHRSRKNPMQSVASISAGYDSTACAALARAAGCKLTHTIYDSKSADPYEDSGAKNAESLGMECLQYDRWEYLKSDQSLEAEFGFNALISTVPLTAMAKDLTGKIYIVGCGGDTLWSEETLPLSSQLAKTWARGIAGMGQLEFRLRTGYCVFSPIYIGVRHTNALQEILTSEEMKPWSIGGDYDRPLARRIAELAGVPRQQFGMKKAATGHSTMRKGELFSKAASTSYHDFRKRMKKRAGLLKTFFHYARYSTHFVLEYRILKRPRRYKASTVLQRKYPFILNNPPFKCPWKFCFTFQWMFDELKKRYPRNQPPS